MFLRIRILKHLALFLCFQIISPLKLGDLAYFIGLNLKSSSRNKLFVPEMVDVSRVVQAKKYIKKWLQPDIHRGKCAEKFTLKSIRFMWANNGTWERRRWKRLNINTYHIESYIHIILHLQKVYQQISSFYHRFPR